jgi:hypothetical protein
VSQLVAQADVNIALAVIQAGVRGPYEGHCLAHVDSSRLDRLSTGGAVAISEMLCEDLEEVHWVCDILQGGVNTEGVAIGA